MRRLRLSLLAVLVLLPGVACGDTDVADATLNPAAWESEDCPYPPGNRMAGTLAVAFSGSRWEWLTIDSIRARPDAVADLTEAESRSVEQYNASDADTSRAWGSPTDPLIVVDLSYTSEKGHGSRVVAAATSRYNDIERALERGSEVVLTLYEESELPRVLRAVAISPSGGVQFLGWCAERTHRAELENFASALAASRSDAWPSSTTDADLVRALLADSDGEIAREYDRLMIKPYQPVPWLEQPPAERTIHDAPQEVIEQMRSVLLSVELTAGLTSREAWVLCTASDFARTGCIAGALLADRETFSIPLFVPDDQTSLRFWFESVELDSRGELQQIDIGSVVIDSHGSSVMVSIDAADPMRLDEAAVRRAAVLISQQ